MIKKGDFKMKLIDFEQRQRQLPDQVERPSRSELKQIRKGCFVKSFLKNGNSIWIQVSGPEQNNRFSGVVESCLPGSGLCRGDSINFEKRHICELI